MLLLDTVVLLAYLNYR